jgi:DNA-binding response OmpR family regulator
MFRRFPRVLIVEDDPTACHMFAKIFEVMWKWDFRKALTAAEAILHVCGPERFDLIVLDLMLPDEPGIEVFKHVLECAPEVPVVVVTGKPIEECGDVAALKPALLLRKPFWFDPVRDLADGIMAEFFAARTHLPAPPQARPAPGDGA